MVRLGCLVAVVLPFVIYAVQYFLAYRTFDGFMPALISGAIESGVDFINACFANPVRAIVFLIVCGAISGIAWGSRR